VEHMEQLPVEPRGNEEDEPMHRNNHRVLSQRGRCPRKQGTTGGRTRRLPKSKTLKTAADFTLISDIC
jgi:hypothetical protein